MKKLTDMKQIFTKNELLDNKAISTVKGGASAIAELVSVVLDDKRRERPGGGISTQ